MLDTLTEMAKIGTGYKLVEMSGLDEVIEEVGEEISDVFSPPKEKLPEVYNQKVSPQELLSVVILMHAISEALEG